MTYAPFTPDFYAATWETHVAQLFNISRTKEAIHQPGLLAAQGVSTTGIKEVYLKNGVVNENNKKDSP